MAMTFFLYPLIISAMNRGSCSVSGMPPEQNGSMLETWEPQSATIALTAVVVLCSRVIAGFHWEPKHAAALVTPKRLHQPINERIQDGR